MGWSQHSSPTPGPPAQHFPSKPNQGNAVENMVERRARPGGDFFLASLMLWTRRTQQLKIYPTWFDVQ